MAVDAGFAALSPGLRRYKVEAAAGELQTLDQRAGRWPWTAQQWAQSLQFDDCWVVSEQQRHLAAAVFAPAVDDIALLNMVVDPTRQRAGLSFWMLQLLLRDYASAGFARCILEVRVSNLPARGLYQKLGFIEDGVRPGYYPAGSGREDAVLMSMSL